MQGVSISNDYLLFFFVCFPDVLKRFCIFEQVSVVRVATVSSIQQKLHYCMLRTNG